MFIPHDQFLKKFRIISMESTPGTTTFQSAVPKDALYHHFTFDGTLGPTLNNLYVNAILTEDDNERIYVEHVTALEKPTKNFRPVPSAEKTFITDYHKRNRRFNRSFGLDKSLKKPNPVIMNYNALFSTYHIIASRKEYTYPDALAYIDTINTHIKSTHSGRVEIVIVNLPQILPGYEDLHVHLVRQTETMKRDVPGYNDVLLIELALTLANLEGSFDGIFKEDVLVALVDTGSVIYINGAMFKEVAEKKTDLQRLSWFTDLLGDLSEMRNISADDKDFPHSYLSDIERLAKITNKVEDVSKTIDEKTVKTATALLRTGEINQTEYDRHIALTQTYQNIPNPIGEVALTDELVRNKTKTAAFEYKPLPKFNNVGDAYITSKIRQMDEQYVKNELDNDLVATMMSIQNGPFAVVGLTKEEKRDAGSHSTIFKMETKGLKGGKGTFPVEIPTIKPDGTFQSGGVRYRMPAQRINIPIAKTGPEKVVLTTDMSKLFMTLSPKVKDDYYGWINNQLRLKRGDGVDNLKMGNQVSNDPDLHIPALYAGIGSKYRSFDIGDYHFDFTEASLAKSDGDFWYCGTHGTDDLFMDDSGAIYTRSGKGAPVYVDTFTAIAGINEDKAPSPFVQIKIKGKEVPLCVLMAYWMGLENSLKYLGIPYQVIPVNQTGVGKNVLALSDCKLLLEPGSPINQMIVNGWGAYRDSVKTLQLAEMGNRKNYSVLFTPKGITKNHELEFTMMEWYWVDPITEKELRKRHQPTELFPLMVYAANLLSNRQHYNENDGRIFIERRLSRVNGIAYEQMMQSIREYYRSMATNRKVSAAPKAVKVNLLTDEAVSPVEEVGPVGVMGERTRITYGGRGGQSGRSLVGRHRVYDKHNIGRISEAWTDDGKAGTVMYYSADPAIDTLYGSAGEMNKDNVGAYLSHTALANPFLVYDDARRGNYSRIHMQAWQSNNGRVIPPIMTGADIAYPHALGDIYALVSEKPGKVTKVEDDMMELTYKDGTTKTYHLGLAIGSAAGKYYPRRYITDRKVGYKFDEQEIIAWDDYWYYRSRYNPTQVNMYNGSWILTAFRERGGTYEDASRISRETSHLEAADMVHVLPVKVGFEDGFKLMVKEGDVVNDSSVLAYITPPGVPLTNEDDPTSLDYFSAGSPKAKYDGTVVRIEVFYMGNPDDASAELKSAITASNKRRKRRSLAEDIFPSGEYTEETYVGKQPLEKNSAVILVYIMGPEAAEGGDKLAWANSLKSVPGKVYDNPYTLPDGTPVGADFSQNGEIARITPGAKMLMLAGMWCRQVGLNGAKLYREG